MYMRRPTSYDILQLKVKIA